MKKHILHSDGLCNRVDWGSTALTLLLVIAVMAALWFCSWNDQRAESEATEKRLKLREVQMVSLMEGRIGSTGN